MSDPLVRSTNEAGDIIVHPHEALQSIAVELHRSNQIGMRILVALEALVKAAEESKAIASSSQVDGMAAAEKLLAPVMGALIGRAAGRAPQIQTAPAVREGE